MDRSRTPMVPSPLSCSLAMAVMLSLVAHGRASAPGDTGLGHREQEALRRYARDTWRSFDAMALTGGLPADGLRSGEDGAWRPTEKTTPTDIAAYLWSTLAAERLRIIEPAEARRRLDQTLAALARIGAGPRLLPRQARSSHRRAAEDLARRRQADPPPALGGRQRLAGGRA